MAIKPANTHFKSFTFNNTVASSYGVYVTDVNVFNAAARNVEYIVIPGRNGAYALDDGSFQNITVEYTCAMEQDSESDFADAISSFRNLLASAKGYCRLVDDIHPNEYRMASFSSGIEVDTTNRKSGIFKVSFDCKPQRFLTSGETAVTVANNGTLSNPTLFDSEPLLAVKGYGTIGFNGYEIEIENTTLGDVVFISGTKTYTEPISVDTNALNIGDIITLNGKSTFFITLTDTSASGLYHDTETLTDSNSDFSTLFDRQNGSSRYGTNLQYNTIIEPQTFVYGTDKTITNTTSGTINMRAGVSNFTVTISITQTISYDAATNEISFSYSRTATASRAQTTVKISNLTFTVDTLIGNSTIPTLGNPSYIDCDIGECYMIKNGELITLNGSISLGSDLPKLASGTNTFTYDNTVTELKVTPRWWKV